MKVPSSKFQVPGFAASGDVGSTGTWNLELGTWNFFSP
jgi:hypothetical protein